MRGDDTKPWPQKAVVTSGADWNALRRSFDGEQLRIVRELRRLTQAHLARKAIEAGPLERLTSGAVSQFELGDSVPTAETLRALALALQVEPIFLTAQTTDREANVPAFFRSLRSTPARERKRARNLVQLVHRLAVALDTRVGLPVTDVPSTPCDPFEESDNRRLAAEEAAAGVRAAWRLPSGPILNVVASIEARGVVCTRLLLEDVRVDAYSVNFSDHPVAVLTTDKDKWDRSRFDAAHELGHLVMHDEAGGIPGAERQANEFAAAFLMPARDIRRRLPDRANWQLLMRLKAEWGVSLAAILMRARTLEVMSESAYVGATKAMSARGWRRHEPVDGESETPTLLNDALERARSEGVDMEELRLETAIPKDLFDEICQSVHEP
jgi:Zn-dependent peptidase ImmA (M78 family)/transcriptional regulator with XRE-family HTH domain